MTSSLVRGGGRLIVLYFFMLKIKFNNKYEDIISVENLLEAWKEFLCGKKKKEDVLEFQRNLMANIFKLHNELKDKTYTHGKYQAFKINDPKPRDIHKAMVRDRLLHHAIYRILYPFFDKKFISDSYSCRNLKGTHRAIRRFNDFVRKVTKNGTRACWILKCDVRKFFASINHDILLNLLKENIADEDIITLLAKVISSFYSTASGVGLPLGNLTSQLLVNIYMNEFDQYAKHKLKAQYYIRYADDFVFFAYDRNELLKILSKIDSFLKEKLKLNLHPNKVSIESISSGVDFLGWVNFADYRVLRTVTKKRMFKRLMECEKEETVSSYLGMLSRGNGYKLKEKIKNMLQ
jgi:RNA-directed DNA polymerase